MSCLFFFSPNSSFGPETSYQNWVAFSLGLGISTTATTPSKLQGSDTQLGKSQRNVLSKWSQKRPFTFTVTLVDLCFKGIYHTRRVPITNVNYLKLFGLKEKVCVWRGTSIVTPTLTERSVHRLLEHVTQRTECWRCSSKFYRVLIFSVFAKHNTHNQYKWKQW